MTTNMIRSREQNPCPVCNRTKDSDCSWYPDGETVMCKTYVDGSGHDESKWHYTGVNELGFQGKFVLKTEKEFVKASRPQSEKHYYYPDREGNNLVRVTRKDDGSGKKSFYQSHWDGGKWAKGNPDEIQKRIPVYRYTEVRDAIARGELIFAVEGEGVADALWDLGIPATTTIGGSGSYQKYGNYSEDLTGARLALSPDRDALGVKYIANFERDVPTQIEGYYLAGSEGLWQTLPKTGGMDIADDIRDHQLTREQILDRIITPEKYRELTTKPTPNAQPKTDSNNCESSETKYQQLAAGLGIPVKTDSDGNPKSRLATLTLDLFELVGDRLKLNLMAGQYEFEGKPIDLDRVKSFVAFNLGADYSTENCLQALHTIGSKFAYQPVREYLEALRGKIELDFNLFENLATVFLGNENELANKFLSKTLISAVARVRQPGTKVDTLTVLQGSQGWLKSTFLKVLAGENWFCDQVRDAENKDDLAKLSCHWLIELAEVDYLMNRKEVESFKRFLSTTVDTFRPPYGRTNLEFPRTCSLWATTNKAEFLADPTGSRRYWVIKVNQKIDCDLVREYRDIIWATAMAAYERGDTWWLSDEEEAQRESAAAEFQEIDPWQEAIETNWSKVPVMERDDLELVRVASIFQMLEVPIERQTKASRNRIGSILRNLGFENKTVWIDGKSEKLFAKNKSFTEKLGKLGKDLNQTNAHQEIHALPNSENSWVRLGKESEVSEDETHTENGIHALPNSLPNFSDSLPNSPNSLPNSPNSLPNLTQPDSTPYLTRNRSNSDTETNTAKPYPTYPTFPQTLGKNFTIGDRVRYVGGMNKHRGKSGTIVKVCGDRYICDFGGKPTEQLPASELEVA
jgi:predicted P-loop ATPase